MTAKRATASKQPTRQDVILRGRAAKKTAARPKSEPVVDERTTAKAKEHADIAREHGWSVNVEANTHGGLSVIASKGDEICVLTYQRNGVLYNQGIVFKVPGRVVALHNSGTWRRQVSLPEGKRPISAKPKRAGRAPKPKAKVEVKTEAPESQEDAPATEEININKSSLPFLHDDEDAVILDHIRGMTLFWRNNMMAKVVSARVPTKARLIRFGTTGRASRRCVSFPEAEMTKDGEIYGAERTVAIESMLRVRP